MIAGHSNVPGSLSIDTSVTVRFVEILDPAKAERGLDRHVLEFLDAYESVSVVLEIGRDREIVHSVIGRICEAFKRKLDV